jgi:hypothetical protein
MKVEAYPMPDKVKVTIITKISLRCHTGLKRLLNAFESVKRFTPTHWGLDERAPNPYNHDELIAAVSTLKSNFYLPGLHRRQAPRYQAYFSATNEDLNYVTVEFGRGLKQKEYKDVFMLGDALATQLEAEFGNVHPIWLKGSQEYCASGRITASELQKYGLTPVCARTWFGSDLVKMIGRECLLSSNAIIQDTFWGGIQLDLAPHPWESDLETLSNQQLSVMKHLKPIGVFGDYTKVLEYKPGVNWKPILNQTSPLTV